MIKKYVLAKNNNTYSKSIICLFYEGKIKINITQKYQEDLNNLFIDYKNINYNVINTPHFKESIMLSIIYFDDETNKINTLILFDSHNNHYYLLTADKEDVKKFFFKERVSGNSNNLEKDYEKNKLRKKYGGEIKSFPYSDENYFDLINRDFDINKNLNKEADVTTYIFNKSQDNKFLTDFVQLFENRIYRVNEEEYNEKWVSLNLDEMSKTRKHRFDSFYVDSSGEVRYFVYTNIRHDIIHYYLFKNNKDKTYSFLLESISLKELIRDSELSNLPFKYASEEENKALSKIWFRDYASAKEDENEEDIELEIEGKIEQDLEEFADKEIYDVNKVFKNQQTIIDFISKHNGYIDKGLVMFKDFEDFPLASLTNEFIKIRTSRYPKNVEFSAQMSIKESQQDKVYSKLFNLLIETPSSRLIKLENLINKAIEYDAKEGSYLDNEIRYLNDSLLESDKNYPFNHYDNLVSKYNEYRKIDLRDNQVKDNVSKSKPVVVEKKTYSRYVNEGKKLMIIGAMIGKGTLDRIKQSAIKNFGFKKNDIQTYGFFASGLHIESLQNPSRIKDTILIVAASDHKIKNLSDSDSLKGAIENNPDKYPKTKFAVDSRNQLCNLSFAKFETLLNEFREEGIIN